MIDFDWYGQVAYALTGGFVWFCLGFMAWAAVATLFAWWWDDEPNPPVTAFVVLVVGAISVILFSFYIVYGLWP